MKVTFASPEVSPLSRPYAAMTYRASGGELLLFGGGGFAPRGDTWAYSYRP